MARGFCRSIVCTIKRQFLNFHFSKCHVMLNMRTGNLPQAISAGQAASDEPVRWKNDLRRMQESCTDSKREINKRGRQFYI